MLRRTFFVMLLLFAAVNVSRSANAQDSNVDLNRGGLLEIDTDDSHDIVLIRQKAGDPEKIEIIILQFNSPVSYFDFDSEEEAWDAADKHRDEYYDYDQINDIHIHVYDGDDEVLIDPNTISIPTFIVGGDGNDYIVGGDGKDEIWADNLGQSSGPSGGSDTIFGNEGVDFIVGGPFADTIYGGLSKDYLFGEDGIDTIYGGPGDDHLWGGNDGDFLYGEAGMDEIKGNDGNDLLDGGYDGEMDELTGGAGADDFVDRYFEVIVEEILQAKYIDVPMLIRDGFTFRVVMVKKLIWVPVTITTYNILELEIVEDFNAADGDWSKAVQVN